MRPNLLVPNTAVLCFPLNDGPPVSGYIHCLQEGRGHWVAHVVTDDGTDMHFDTRCVMSVQWLVERIPDDARLFFASPGRA